jgi:hypothetical protein
LLLEVRHVLDLRRNLIFRGQLSSEGYIVTFSNKVWKVIKGALVVANGDKVGTLYFCIGNTYSTLATIKIVAIEIVTTHLVGTKTKLWHCIIGHMREKGMKILHSRKLLPSLK